MSVPQSAVVVLDLNRPRFTFLSWFLAQAGIRSEPVHPVEEALDSLPAGQGGVVVVNARAPAAEITDTVTSLHLGRPRPMVVAYDDARDGAGTTGADLAISRPTDVDDIITPLVRALRSRPGDAADDEDTQAAAGGEG